MYLNMVVLLCYSVYISKSMYIIKSSKSQRTNWYCVLNVRRTICCLCCLPCNNPSSHAMRGGVFARIWSIRPSRRCSRHSLYYYIVLISIRLWYHPCDDDVLYYTIRCCTARFRLIPCAFDTIQYIYIQFYTIPGILIMMMRRWALHPRLYVLRSFYYVI